MPINANKNSSRGDPCRRPRQIVYVGYYYKTLHRQIKEAVSVLPGAKPDYVGGFFY